MQLNRIRLSTPKFCIISRATAVDALPDIGLISIRGRSSDGILSKDNTGDRRFANRSKMPEFLRLLIAKNNAISVGKI